MPWVQLFSNKTIYICVQSRNFDICWGLYCFLVNMLWWCAGDYPIFTDLRRNLLLRWPVNSQHKGPVTRKMFPWWTSLDYITSYVNKFIWWRRIHTVCYEVNNLSDRKGNKICVIFSYTFVVFVLGNLIISEWWLPRVALTLSIIDKAWHCPPVSAF